MPSRVKHRRQSWKGAALIILIGLMPLALTGCGQPEEPDDTATTATPTTSTDQPTTDPQTTIYTRREIATFTPAETDALRKGIALMQQRPSSDPTSWLYQANIHGVPGQGANCPANTDPEQEAWATCQHGSYFFLAWHRMYLYYFERILRDAVQEAAGDPNLQFALPYWDYSTRQLPDTFRAPTDPSNTLFVAQRRTLCNSPQAGQECVSETQGSSTQALTLIPYCNCPDGQATCDGCTPGLTPDETFGGEFTPQPEHFLGQFGELESQPHNVIHNRVGGFSGWMSDADCAARDPIFWLHHANIDRLWQVWLNQGGRLDPLGSTAWTTQKFVFFDENKTKIEMTGCQVLNMATQLGYQYDGVPVNNVQLCNQQTPPAPGPEAVPAPPAAAQELAATPERAVTLGSAPVKVSVPIPAGSRQRMGGLAEAGQPEKLRLVIEGLELVDHGGVYDVYMNLPQGQKPDPKGPHFVGHLALFGHAGHGQESSRSFDITDDLRRIQQRGAWDGQINLTFVLSDGDTPGTGAEAAPAQLIRFRQVSIITRQP
jgi:hypothetical protein